MSVDCEKRQTADGWRRNSQKWGSQGWEGGPTSPPCGIPQTPPPIPAPPSSDPQDCLTKEAPSTEAFFSNNEQNGNATEKETKFWWEMDDEEPEPSPVVDIPKNKKFFWEEEEEEAEENNGNMVKQYEYSDEERESSSPWRRSRSRTNSPPRTTTFQLAAPPTGRSRQSRNPVRDLNCPTGDTSRQSTSPQVRRRSRPPSNEPESVSDSCSSVPIRRRQRNTENEIPNGPSQISESNRSSSPPVRRRTREVRNENEVGDQQTGNEVSYPVRTRSRSRALQTQENNGISERTTENDSTYPVRIRSRSRALESPQNNINASETTQENHSTTDSPVRRRSRNASSQGPVNDEEVERPNSTSPPLRTRVRNPSEEEEEDWGEDSKKGNEDKELESFEWDDFNEIEEVDEDKENEDNKEVVEEDEEDEVAKATRIWLENQNARLLGVPLPMKIINLTEEEMKFDPLQKLETENIPTAYETWDAEPADQEVSPEFLNKKLRKVEKPDYDLRSQTTRSRRNRTEENGIKIPSDETPSDIPLPPPPPPPPKSSKVPPPPPPPPPIAPPMSKKDKEVKRAREDMVESIKKAARSRPDWHSVMKDIEFVYESEKPMMHNQMLEQIQRGVRLRHVRTNDRSRPDFNRLGIRKLRRQVTTDEKKTVDPDTPDALPSSSDEEEDIDQMRDDLQSTKTQLAEEIKKTKKIERENKILKIDIDSLQAEVKRMKRRLKEAGINEAKPLANGEADAIAPKLSKSMSKLRMREEDMDFSELDDIEEDIKILNEQIEAQKKRAEQAEQKCEELTQKMQVADNSTDEWELRSIYFEKKFKSLQKDQGIELPDINCIGTQTETVEISSAPEGPGALPTKKSQSRKSFGKLNRMESFKEEETEESSSDEEESLSEAAEGEEEEVQEELESEDEEVSAERRAENESIKRERELKLWHNKLGHAKEKIKNVKRERNNLRDRIKKYYKDMRKEREEYLKVKAELKEMADQMKEDEESVIDDSYEPTDDSDDDSVQQDEEDPEWWCEDAPKKPKKKLKKRKRKIISEEKQEEILNNDEPNDMSDLADPEWPGTDDADSETDDEEEDIKLRIKKLKDRVDLQEQHLNEKKKDTYLLKAQIDQCDEKYGDERRRNARINNELQLLFADI